MTKTGCVDEVIERAHGALDALACAPPPSDPGEALVRVREVERLARRVRALQIGTLDAVHEQGLHRADGHASGRVMVEHAGRLSEAEAKRRDRARRTLAAMPVVAAGLASGRIGACQVDRIALVFVNPRVRDRFVALDAQVALLAATLTYPEFDRRLRNWVRQVDEEGTADRARRCHENRRARLVQDFDGGWELLGAFGSLTGAQMHTIFKAFVEAEFQADWAEARAIHGDATTVAHLARSYDQRDADAIARIFELAANAHAVAPGGAPIDTTILVDQASFERELRRAAGLDLEPRPDPGLAPEPGDEPAPASEPGERSEPDAEGEGPSEGGDEREGASAPARGTGFRCETPDGHPVDPTEAFANALTGRVRRAVVGWDGVVIDHSGHHKLFTGALRAAVLMSRTTCYWPGCNQPVSRCQADHLEPRRSGGRTNPGNGAPCCGRHNRLKEHGFTVRRDDHGRIHVHRPDGTEIE
jgi:hypothetical protein